MSAQSYDVLDGGVDLVSEARQGRLPPVAFRDGIVQEALRLLDAIRPHVENGRVSLLVEGTRELLPRLEQVPGSVSLTRFSTGRPDALGAERFHGLLCRRIDAGETDAAPGDSA